MRLPSAGSKRYDDYVHHDALHPLFRDNSWAFLQASHHLSVMLQASWVAHTHTCGLLCQTRNPNVLAHHTGRAHTRYTPVHALHITPCFPHCCALPFDSRKPHRLHVLPE